MAIKKGLFQEYAKNQDVERKIRTERAKRSKYSHGEVFDESGIDNISKTQAKEKKLQSNSTNTTVSDSSTDKNKACLKPTAVKETKKRKIVADTPKKSAEHQEEVTSLINLNNYQIVQQIVSLKGHQKKLYTGLLVRARKSNSNIIDKSRARN